MLTVKNIVLTGSHFYRYEKHPLWIWYDLFGDQSKKEKSSDFTRMLCDKGKEYEKKYISERNVIEVTEIDSDQGFKKTLELMRAGVDEIYQGWIQFNIAPDVMYRGRPDLLKKVSGKSSLGDWYYNPVEIKLASSMEDYHRHQLIFYSIILEKLQGQRPSEIEMIGRYDRSENCFLSRGLDIDEKHVKQTEDCIAKILNVMNGNKPEFTITSEAKESSPWFNVAKEEAKAAKDLALIYKLDSRSLTALRAQGINTLHDLIGADISRLKKIPYASHETLEKKKLQAEALIRDKRIPISNSDIKRQETALNIYFDMEGVPNIEGFSKVDYLFGILISGDPAHKYMRSENVQIYDDGRYYLFFLAESPDDEKKVWLEFLKWVECLPEEYTVYHYSYYERVHLDQLAEKYGSSTQRFTESLVDLEKKLKEHFIFPVYFYSLKDIAKELDFKYLENVGGLQSIVWYETWLTTGDRKHLDAIIDYNKYDVRAIETLNQWMKDNIKQA